MIFFLAFSSFCSSFTPISFSQSFLFSHQQKPPAISSRRPPSLATAFTWKLSFAAMGMAHHNTLPAMGNETCIPSQMGWIHIDETQHKNIIQTKKVQNIQFVPQRCFFFVWVCTLQSQEPSPWKDCRG